MTKLATTSNRDMGYAAFWLACVLLCCSQTPGVAGGEPTLDDLRRQIAETIVHPGVRVVGFARDNTAVVAEVSRENGHTRAVTHVTVDRSQAMPVDRIGMMLPGMARDTDDAFATAEELTTKYQHLGFRQVTERGIPTGAGWLFLGEGYLLRWNTGRIELRGPKEWQFLAAPDVPMESEVADLVFDKKTDKIVCLLGSTNTRGRFGWHWIELSTGDLPHDSRLPWSERIAALAAYTP
ncbi:MAG: hypothetical protein HUU55_03305 [Myxococcales bacterium]|nr:hypothetical protein [Myxococcales bacterium]